MVVLKNRWTNEYKSIPMGYSWTSLFFGVFVPLWRADIVGFLLQLGLAFITCGASWLVVPFLYNGRYVNRLLKSGDWVA